MLTRRGSRYQADNDSVSVRDEDLLSRRLSNQGSTTRVNKVDNNRSRDRR